MKAVGYVRVSTDKQTDRGVSLDAQAEKIRAMSVVHNAELIDIVVDGGESAKSLQRLGIERLLALVVAKKVEAVWWPSWIGSREALKIFANFSNGPRAVVSPCAESLDTSSAAGRLVLNIMTAVSQWEREAIGERTRDAMSHKQTNGERVGNIRFGYRLGADGKHGELDPVEQNMVREIHELRRSGHSMRNSTRS
jgi:DNA invertase Pin-like site-specific DNA recombinase